MAFRPSLRKHRKEPNTELNLNPLLDVMTVLIPLLLANAQFAKIGVIELNLPPAAGATGVAQSATGLPKENERHLDLVVTITDKGFYVASAVSSPEEAAMTGPALPVNTNGEYDLAGLSRKLYEVKQKAGAGFADPEAIVIQAEPEISYQILVSTMDAARSIRVEGKNVTLFPNVALSAGVL
jgi:biopolymer transport protein ExbD